MKSRCERCWLRLYDCHCDSISRIREEISKSADEEQQFDVRNVTNSSAEVEISLTVCMYYHYSEIGRSANTAHFFEAILNDSAPKSANSFVSCKSVVFGDIQAEDNLVDQMRPVECRGRMQSFV